MASKKINQYVERTIQLSDEASSKEVARWLWLEINKNKDYKNLDQILKEIETKAADRQGKKLVYLRSHDQPPKPVIETIKNKLEKRFNSEVILKHVPDKKIIGGFKIEVDGQIEDFSLNNSLDRLKRALS